jgi:glycerol kinase
MNDQSELLFMFIIQCLAAKTSHRSDVSTALRTFLLTAPRDPHI